MINIKIAKKEDLVPGAVVLILDENDRVLILLRSEESRWAPNQWGYPGGKIEMNESALDAAVRETKEETSLEVYNLKKMPTERLFKACGFYTRHYQGSVVIDHEHRDWAWAAPESADNYILAPEVLEMYDWVLENE